MRLIFVTWDGPGTAYHEALFVPLLEGVLAEGDTLALLQFTWGDAERSRRLERLTRDRGITYHRVEVRRGAGALFFPIALWRGLWWIRDRIAAGAADTVMARSIIPGGLVTFLRRCSRRGFTFVYDADGLSADERADFAGWSRSGLRYRLFRRLERAAVRNADLCLTRTRRAAAILRDRSRKSPDRFAVVINGKDASEFRPSDTTERSDVRRRLDVPLEAPLVIYAGSIGPQYEPELMLRTFAAIRAEECSAQFLILTHRRNHEPMHRLAQELNAGDIMVREAQPDEVGRYLGASDLGLAFRTPTLSQAGVAPIKVAEYLLCGLPVAYRCGVGDLDDQLSEEVGFAVAGAEDQDARLIAHWFLEILREPGRDAIRERARSLGLACFSLSAGVASYRSALDSIPDGTEVSS